MPLIVVDYSVLENLDRVTRLRVDPLFVGLYQSAGSIDRHLLIGGVVPCTFSGYDGLRPIVHWTVPAMTGPLAITRADPVLWTYDGGNPTGFVAGYYVVDVAGRLRWIEPIQTGPRPLTIAGQVHEVDPAFSSSTLYGAES